MKKRMTLQHVRSALSLLLACACAITGCATRSIDVQTVQMSPPAQTISRSTPPQDLPAPAADPPDKVTDLGIRQSFVVPALDVVAVGGIVHATGRGLLNREGTFSVTRASIARNLRRPWVVDDDPYAINQIGHPYQGAMYHAAGRSAGLDYWQSAAYTFAGSVLWEIAGETTSPSVNDQIASGIAGSFLGEALFRTANLLIAKADGRPRSRMWLVALLSPPTAFNRGVFGDRFDGVMDPRDPLYDVRLQVGANGAVSRAPEALTIRPDETVLNLSIEYGLPGRRGYEYRRPFDHFSLQATASSANGLESVLTRGLISGRDYARGEALRGVWGLYGIYDYISPQVFRVSTAALSVGTSAQSWLSNSMAIQGTVMGGIGYAAAQTTARVDDGTYHYGVTPQTVATLRLLFGRRMAFDVGAHQYFVSDVGGFDVNSDDVIFRGEASVGVRFYKRNAISLRYLMSRRDFSGPPEGDTTRRRATVGVFYTLLGPQHFGAVDWRREGSIVR